MPQSRKTKSKRPPSPYRPEIIVRFREGGEIEEKGRRLRATHLSLRRFHKTLGKLTGSKVRRSFRLKRPALDALGLRARRRKGRRFPGLDLFVRVQIFGDQDPKEWADRISRDPEVVFACPAAVPAPPPQTPDYSLQQGHLHAAPDGVDSSWAWFYPGGDGSGIQVCDCEYGCNLSHEDLPGATVVSNLDGDLTQYADHGTAVLGVMAGVDNGLGVTGVCPGASFLFGSESGWHRTDCIGDAIASLQPGDVLLLEMQAGIPPYKPVEYDPDIHAAIVTAVASGIVVVEAAANGGVDLGTTSNGAGKYIWDPAHADHDDSGAIFVGGGASSNHAAPHSRLETSNYGLRVDCQGWGEDVLTAGYGDLYDGGPNRLYTETFDGTSSAAPVVAGIAACLQGAAREATGTVLDPGTLRGLLRDPACGTPQSDSPAYPAASFPVGPLPDLRRLIPAAGVRPDVFMRDHISDTGEEPFGGALLCRSPDIIPRQNPVPDPEAVFGAGAWDDGNLGQPVEAGQDNHVYVRIANRGNAPDDVSVSVYWTPASSFPHPAAWNLIGTLEVPGVVPGEHRVAGPVAWPAESIPPTGHFCLVAVVDSVRDPLELPDAFSSVQAYLDFVRLHNNLCYRNVEVVDVTPDAPPPSYSFLMRGLPRKAARFRLAVHHRLPPGGEIDTEIRKRLPGRVGTDVLKAGRRRVKRRPDLSTFRAQDARPLHVRDIPLYRMEEVEVRISIRLPRNAAPGRYRIYADQFWGKAQLGRVNLDLRVRGKARQRSGPRS
jgi:hypothetical protein